MDEELEALIDRAGRDDVFAVAQSWGWCPGTTPPKYVWASIAADIINRKDRGESPAYGNYGGGSICSLLGF